MSTRALQTLPHLVSAHLSAPRLEVKFTTKGTCQGQLDFWLAPCHQDLFCSAVEIGAGQNGVVPNFSLCFHFCFPFKIGFVDISEAVLLLLIMVYAIN